MNSKFKIAWPLIAMTVFCVLPVMVLAFVVISQNERTRTEIRQELERLKHPHEQKP